MALLINKRNAVNIFPQTNYPNRKKNISNGKKNFSSIFQLIYPVDLKNREFLSE